MKHEYTIFGKSKMVPLITYTDGKLDNPPRQDFIVTLWVERAEDLYALDYYRRTFPGAAIAVVEKDIWKDLPEI